MGFGIAIVLGVLAIIAIAIYFSWLYEKKRTQQLQEIAQQMSLTFNPAGTLADLNEFQRLGIFKLGSGRKVANLLYGETDEVAIRIFDYQYTTGSGKNTHTHKMTIAALESPRLEVLPEFSMRPENLFDRLGSMLGFQDIDFDEHPEFSRLFVLKGPDEAAIRQSFRPAVLDWFAARPGICVEAIPGRLIYYRSSRRAKVEDYPKILGEAYQVFGAIVD